MKATPGGSSECSEGRKAGPFRLRELGGRCIDPPAASGCCEEIDSSNRMRSLTPSTIETKLTGFARSKKETNTRRPAQGRPLEV